MSSTIWTVNLLKQVNFLIALKAWLLQSTAITISRNHSIISPLSLRVYHTNGTKRFKVIYSSELVDTAVTLKLT
jgi:hypothetical protein